MAWTKEQKLAIDLEGTNIIVSAGAGSGKTAVLTERAKRKVLEGVHVNELLVLTFTNAAAAEMKDRIREAIKSTPSLKDELNIIDGAYITTFDAFSLAILKKYHTRLNITNNIKVSDEVVIDLVKKKLLDEIFDERYLLLNSNFTKLIDDFCLKDDKELKDYILNIYKKIELKYNKTEFINDYFSIFNDDKINSFVLEYIELIKNKQSIIRDLVVSLNDYFDYEFVSQVEDSLAKFLNATTYSDFLDSMDYGTVRVPRGSSEEGKEIKNQIFSMLKEIKDNLLIYSSEDEIFDDIVSTKSNVEVIISILKDLDKRVDNYKRENDVFNFNDIARLAIKVVEDNPDIRDELKNSFKEIMVDEYQDTSDTQEKFISLISSNNVYMVGDIKQSIYRFRNANPYIFKNKYDTYRDTDVGEKIDLLKNFRSRDEVLKNINLLFDFVMDDKIGGADYQKSHRMVFGNTSYIEEGNTNQNYNLDVITYNKDELDKLSVSEEEAFIIGYDILDKIKNKYQIFDKKTKILRDCQYSDFVILLDKSRDFDLYKKIFEYLHIPLTILKEESLKKDNDLYIFRSLLKLLISIKNKNFDNTFKYSFISICRSYLYRLSDSEIYNYFINNNYSDSELYKICLDLIENIDTMNPSRFFRLILEKFDYDIKLLNTNNIKSNRIRAEYFYNLICDYEKTGGTIEDFITYLDQIIDEDYDLKFNVNSESNNSCMIMTIHKSKGLEYPICYFAGFSSKFNMSELKEKIIFDNQYGIILPKVDNYYKDTILKLLLKNRSRIEEISERIRLLYVAVTRAKEKMIIVMPEVLEEKEVLDVVPFYEREKYSSFLSIMKSIYSVLIPYVKKSEIIGSKKYLENSMNSNLNINNCDKIKVCELDIDTNEVVEMHYSKESLKLITREEKEVMDFGTKVHEILEEVDFNDLSLLNSINDKYIKNKILSFINSDLMKDYLDKKMYKEYEFLYKIDNLVNHGIIDLLIEDDDKYIIIDYKLKNISDSLYDKQLNGYREYITNKTGKKCLCYLYSIIDEKYWEINYE